MDLKNLEEALLECEKLALVNQDILNNYIKSKHHLSDREVLILENYIKMFYITTEDPVGYICKNTLEALLKAISLFPFSILGNDNPTIAQLVLEGITYRREKKIELWNGPKAKGKDPTLSEWVKWVNRDHKIKSPTERDIILYPLSHKILVSKDEAEATNFFEMNAIEKKVVITRTEEEGANEEGKEESSKKKNTEMEREATTIENVEENAEEQIEMERNKGKKQKENESGRKRKRDNAVHTTEIRRKSTEEKLARRVDLEKDPSPRVFSRENEEDKEEEEQTKEEEYPSRNTEMKHKSAEEKQKPKEPVPQKEEEKTAKQQKKVGKDHFQRRHPSVQTIKNDLALAKVSTTTTTVSEERKQKQTEDKEEELEQKQEKKSKENPMPLDKKIWEQYTPRHGSTFTNDRRRSLRLCKEKK